MPSPEKDGPDFVWCYVRWKTDDAPGEHVCAQTKPGHTEHVCCCGAVIPPGTGDTDA